MSIFALCASSFLLWHYVHPLLVILVMPFLGAQIYKITIIMHDCCHSSLFESRKTNWAVGVVSGFFVGTMFANFCKMHWKHHETYGEDEDPQGDDYLHLEDAPRSDIAWHLSRPLLGYNLRKLLSFDRAEATENSSRLRITAQDKIIFIVGTVLVQLLILLAATGGLQVLWLALLYPLCAATFALFFSQVRGFVEHVALPGVSPKHHARTYLPNLLDRLFFYTLNFNYHIEIASPAFPASISQRSIGE
ncbi:MAG TPA: fatty acid desaturase [Hyphomicrobium sp.]|nr:fatty acid desaturase [Hyphomicrobium sp.]